MHSLPKSILLGKFNYQPLLKRIKADKIIEQNENVIQVSGQSSDSDAFSQWISLLEGNDWIVDVAILNYGSASSKVSDFTIEIGVEND